MVGIFCLVTFNLPALIFHQATVYGMLPSVTAFCTIRRMASS